jgi:Outer membrane protein beta-barrel domain
LNLAKLSETSGGTTISYESKIGLQLGVIAEIGLSENLVFQPGLLYTRKGTTINYGSSFPSIKININYFEIPLNFLYKFPLGSESNKFFVNLGPYIGYAISGNFSDGTDSKDLKIGTTTTDNVTPFDLGLNFGAGVNLGKLLINLNYGLGLSNISSLNNENVKNTNLSLCLGYFF